MKILPDTPVYPAPAFTGKIWFNCRTERLSILPSFVQMASLFCSRRGSVPWPTASANQNLIQSLGDHKRTDGQEACPGTNVGEWGRHAFDRLFLETIASLCSSNKGSTWSRLRVFERTHDSPLHASYHPYKSWGSIEQHQVDSLFLTPCLHSGLSGQGWGLWHFSSLIVSTSVDIQNSHEAIVHMGWSL